MESNPNKTPPDKILHPQQLAIAPKYSRCGEWLYDFLPDGLNRDIEVCLKVFADTSTLTERFTAEQANALFCLGVYLILIEQPTLESHVCELTIEKQEPYKVCLAIERAARQVSGREFESAEPRIDLRLHAWFQHIAPPKIVSETISTEDARGCAHWFAHAILNSAEPLPYENPIGA
jgi:hypothetical protein